MSSGIRRIPRKPNRPPSAPAPPRPPTTSRLTAPPPPPDTRPSVEYTLSSAQLPRTHNVMRFQSNKDVNFDNFTPPIKLRRRNKDYFLAKEKKLQQTQEEEEEPTKKPKGAADLNLIADVGGARSNKRNMFKRRTKQVFFADEEKRRLDIEESKPWMLEDDDEKQVWTGSLEGAQTSSSYVLFVLTEDGFKVVPVDRWYKFVQKLQYKTLTLDEAEEALKKPEGNRWMMHKRQKPKEEPKEPKQPSGIQNLVEHFAAKNLKSEFGGGHQGDGGEADELDFEMEFDDDEEMGDVQFEYNQEEAEQKRRQRDNTHRDDQEGEGEEEEEVEMKKEEREMKKLMKKREGNTQYLSDEEEENPYLSISEIEESEEEEEEEKPKETKEEKKKEKPPATPIQPSVSPIRKRKRSATPQHQPHKLHRHTSNESVSSINKHKRQATPQNDSRDLITKQEVIDYIKGGANTTDKLIESVRKKLKANDANKKRLKAIVKEVAVLNSNRQLVLKKS